jgi:4-hydroxy-2-oxoheptanedioate aldolase
MRIQSLRKKLLQDRNFKSYGPMILSASPSVAELLATIGYSHILVDMEHSPLDISKTVEMLRAIDSVSSGYVPIHNTPIVRAPSHDDVAMTKRILDVLKPPSGIMFPMIETVEQAEKAVASTRYPPHYRENSGIRGCAHPFVRASSYGSDEDYFPLHSNQDLLTILQVESEAAIENIPEIGMVGGVDAIFLGPFDISCSVNQVGEFGATSDVMQLIRHAERLVRETDDRKRALASHSTRKEYPTGLILGGFRPPLRSLQEMFSAEVGYQFICGSVDLGLLRKAAYSDLAEANESQQEAMFESNLSEE